MSSQLDIHVANTFAQLPYPNDTVLAEYVWIGGSGQDLRSKTKTLRGEHKDGEFTIRSLDQLPVW